MSPKISKPKVVFIAPSFGPSGGEIRILECIKRWHAKSSFEEIHVMTTKRGAAILKNMGLHDVKVYILPLIPQNEPYFFARNLTSYFPSTITKTVLSIFLTLRMVHAKLKPDIVIAPSHFISDLIPATIYAKLTKAKLVVYMHHLHPPISIRAKYHPIWLSLLAQVNDIISIKIVKIFVDRILILPSAEHQAINRGIPKHKIRIFKNGIDLEYIVKTPKGIHEYDACFLGRIVPLKGIYDFIGIWKNVLSRNPDAKLAIIGEGPPQYLNKLKRAIETNGLSKNIILEGYLPEGQKYSFLKACKLFTFPSYEEGWGIVVCEAMACGLPVVAYDLPAYKMFGDAIIKVPVGDLNTFSEAVTNLLSNKELRKEISQKAEKKSEDFDWDKLVEGDLRTLLKTLDPKGDMTH